MRARQLIDSASYGPEALKAIGQAFDEAWREIAGNFGNDPRDIELARVQLAAWRYQFRAANPPERKGITLGTGLRSRIRNLRPGR